MGYRALFDFRICVVQPVSIGDLGFELYRDSRIGSFGYVPQAVDLHLGSLTRSWFFFSNWSFCSSGPFPMAGMFNNEMLPSQV
jgi:hypothetical protein